MKLITEKEYRDFIKFRGELNELIIAKTTQLSLLLLNRIPHGTCYNYDFEEENGEIIVQFESSVFQDTDYETFYLPLEFLFDESYPEKYKLIWEEEKRKEREEKERKFKEKEEHQKKVLEEYDKKEYERLKLKFENNLIDVDKIWDKEDDKL